MGIQTPEAAQVTLDTTHRFDPEARSRTAIKLRRVDIEAMDQQHQHVSLSLNIPRQPLFEEAFSAFARGTVIQGEQGEIAVEDLLPGDRLWTGSGEAVAVQWIGAATFSPTDPMRTLDMVRLVPDVFGPGRPHLHVTLGSHTRILQRPIHQRDMDIRGPVLTPVFEFMDGAGVIAVHPPTPVTFYNLVLQRHTTIRAGGIECESFHPGLQGVRKVSHALRDRFLDMFPHVTSVADFGPLAHPRAEARDPELVAAGYL